jgi:acetyl esterase/lipase
MTRTSNVVVRSIPIVRLVAAAIFLFALTVATSAQARVERDVPYVAGAGADQRLDLHLPEGARGFPTVIFFHGGSLQETGERRSSLVYARVCEPFVSALIACATVDYRLAPAFKWPAMPDDAAAAVKWVKSNIAQHAGDPARIFLFGHSSGCHLAAILGANPKYLARVGLTPASVAGIIAMGCVLAPLEEATARRPMDELRTRWLQSNETSTFASFEDRLDSDPSRFIGEHTPPTLVVIAEAERFFPAILEQGAKFVRRLLQMNRPADVVLVPGNHMSSIQNLVAPGDPTLAAILRFINDPAAAGRGNR